MAKHPVVNAMVDALTRPLGRRGYRFDGEQDNHAEQAAQTGVSLGLMAAAAQRTDDDGLRQALQTEHTMRERLTVLNDHRRQRGLTQEEAWERASIIKGLEALGTPATLETLGDKPMSLFGAVGQPRRFLPALPGLAWAQVLMTPWTLVVLALAGVGVQTARLNNAKDDLTEARGDLAAAVRSLETARETAERLADGIQQADAQTRATAELVERERRRRSAAEREARRIRDAMEQARAGSPVEYGFGGVRDAEPVPGAGDGGGDSDGGGSR